jgi:putative FmdB family regulatory protein
MPLYEYQCTACGHRFEVIRKFSDAPLTECPRCQGQVEKLISSPAFHLKGTGWYATDYAKKSDSASSKSENKAEGKAESKTESAGSESKASESKSTETSSGDSSSKDSAGSTPKSSS